MPPEPAKTDTQVKAANKAADDFCQASGSARTEKALEILDLLENRQLTDPAALAVLSDRTVLRMIAQMPDEEVNQSVTILLRQRRLPERAEGILSSGIKNDQTRRDLLLDGVIRSTAVRLQLCDQIIDAAGDYESVLDFFKTTKDCELGQTRVAHRITVLKETDEAERLLTSDALDSTEAKKTLWGFLIKNSSNLPKTLEFLKEVEAQEDIRKMMECGAVAEALKSNKIAKAAHKRLDQQREPILGKRKQIMLGGILGAVVGLVFGFVQYTRTWNRIERSDAVVQRRQAPVSEALGFCQTYMGGCDELEACQPYDSFDSHHNLVVSNSCEPEMETCRIERFHCGEEVERILQAPNRRSQYDPSGGREFARTFQVPNPSRDEVESVMRTNRVVQDVFYLRSRSHLREFCLIEGCGLDRKTVETSLMNTLGLGGPIGTGLGLMGGISVYAFLGKRRRKKVEPLGYRVNRETVELMALIDDPDARNALFEAVRVRDHRDYYDGRIDSTIRCVLTEELAYKILSRGNLPADMERELQSHIRTGAKALDLIYSRAIRDMDVWKRMKNVASDAILAEESLRDAMARIDALELYSPTTGHSTIKVSGMKPTEVRVNLSGGSDLSKIISDANESETALQSDDERKIRRRGHFNE